MFVQPGQVKYILQTRKHRIRDWRAGSVAESEHCFSREPEFSSQPHITGITRPTFECYSLLLAASWLWENDHPSPFPSVLGDSTKVVMRTKWQMQTKARPSPRSMGC